MSLTVPEFLKPYTNGYVDGESGETPVTAAILNTNYDAYLLALNTFLASLAENVEANPSEQATAGNLTKLKVGDSIYMIPSGGSGGSSVSWQQIQLSGTKIATITIDGNDIDVYAPSGGGSGDSVSWTQTIGSGTKIGTITINGTPTDVYAPTPTIITPNPSSEPASWLEKITIDQTTYMVIHNISDQRDVLITNLQNGQILKWNSTTSKWENADESTGGHTILNDSGTSLAQEDDLQFKGVYSHDDSTNGKTVVDIYREMTKAQFDQLSAAEKVGFIRTTDEPDIASIVNGVFIDTDNVIVNTTQISASGLSGYTATEDCVAYIYLWGENNTVIKIDNVEVSANYGNSKDVYLIPLKKGQTLSTTAGNSNNTYQVYGVQQGTQIVPWVDLSDTLTAGSTTLTFTNSIITTNSVIDYYTDTFGVEPTNIVVAAGSITLTFDAQQSDVGVKVRIS